MIPIPETQWLDVRMPFSDEVKYIILAVSILLFIIAMGILVWQLQRCCPQHHSPKDSMSSLVTEGDNGLSGSYPKIQTPRLKEEYSQHQSGRLSRCLSRCDSIPPSSPSILSCSLDSLGEEEQEEEEEVRGSLHFSLYYDQTQALLVVTVLEARDLPLRSYHHHQRRNLDPLVRVRLLWARDNQEDGDTDVEEEEEDEEGGEEEEEEVQGKGGSRRRKRRRKRSVRSGQHLQCVLKEWQSRPVRNSSSPAFGEQFSYTLPEDEVPHVTVKLEVQDYDKYSRHETVGEVRTPLADLNISYPLDLWQDLQRPSKDLVGEVLLSLKYMPTSQRLEVGVLKIRMISKSSRTDRAVYVRASVQCNQCRLHHQKTAVKTHWDVMVFNEALVFLLPDAPVHHCRVTLNVYEVHPGKKKASKHLIGQLSIGKGRQAEDEHWRLMMRSLRQPIAKWHLLHI
ncbi:synaptotagmin-6 [Engraulis encrasicolus]|uniref:synaptotagmin-6 n=1 Tax=Engraulis encrasicolus TaxID=184585 RepID=UPI002FD4B4D5